MKSTLATETINNLLADLQKRVDAGILEPNNLDFLKRLLDKAESEDEAISICKLGTTFYKTGLVFDRKLEVPSDEVKYFCKNEKDSFSNGGIANKLIIGDNYDALLNLQVEYSNRVDVIYIDPPYGSNKMGEFAKTNYQNQINRDNLLSMLQPRLMLAKQLLSDTGVIFCSIDDKNYAYVKCLFDEVFEERNYAGTIIWQKKKKPSFLSKNFGTIFEYILCYVKDESITYPFSIETTTLGKKYPFNNAGNGRATLNFPAGYVQFNMPDGIVRAQDMSGGNIYTVLLNDVEIRDGKNVNEFSLEGEWRYNQVKLNEIVSNNEMITIAQVPFRPNHVKCGGEIKKMKNFLSQKSYNCETNEDGTNEIEEIFGCSVFDNPKPVGLVKNLIKATTYDKKNAIILDFFAGSGTTGQAVLELNQEDNSERSFILVQLPEPIMEDDMSITSQNGIRVLDKMGRPRNLANITIERLWRVMNGVDSKGKKDFEWSKNNKPLGQDLFVIDINKTAANSSDVFRKIDESIYGFKPFDNLKDKTEWVCDNFEKVARRLDDAAGS